MVVIISVLAIRQLRFHIPGNTRVWPADRSRRRRRRDAVAAPAGVAPYLRTATAVAKSQRHIMRGSPCGREVMAVVDGSPFLRDTPMR